MGLRENSRDLASLLLSLCFQEKESKKREEWSLVPNLSGGRFVLPISETKVHATEGTACLSMFPLLYVCVSVCRCECAGECIRVRVWVRVWVCLFGYV